MWSIIICLKVCDSSSGLWPVQLSCYQGKCTREARCRFRHVNAMEYDMEMNSYQVQSHTVDFWTIFRCASISWFQVVTQWLIFFQWKNWCDLCDLCDWRDCCESSESGESGESSKSSASVGPFWSYLYLWIPDRFKATIASIWLWRGQWEQFWGGGGWHVWEKRRSSEKKVRRLML